MTEDQRERLRNLGRLWNDIALSHSQEEFERRFFSQLRRLNRFELDFPDENPRLLLRVLEINVIAVIHREFPPDKIVELLPQLKEFGPSSAEQSN